MVDNVVHLELHRSNQYKVGNSFNSFLIDKNLGEFMEESFLSKVSLYILTDRACAVEKLLLRTPNLLILQKRTIIVTFLLSVKNLP